MHTGPDLTAADKVFVEYPQDDIGVTLDLPDKFAPLLEDGFDASQVVFEKHATLMATLEDVEMYTHAR